ncbi:MAG: cysteine--tRNA ligase, partial [Verrucomicrobia bacterium]|nr:cysteine--tRNA ligase [Verrucomicrobiota bacterium]
FFTLRDLIDKGFQGREVRQLLLSSHYRETFNFTLDGLAGARTALGRIEECVGKLRELADDSPTEPEAGLLARFTEALDDDLNISAAWATVFEWVRDTNRKLTDQALSPQQAGAALAAWNRVDAVLGVGQVEETRVPEILLQLLEARQAARKARDFKRADEIRDELKAEGWVIEDTPKGSKLKKLQATT